MVAVAGSALWLGGWVWVAFVALVAMGVYAEWTRLVLAFAPQAWLRILWLLGGAIYVLIASSELAMLHLWGGVFPVLLMIGAVVATDIGAYFAGRSFGGPKIAPKVSPSKTWSGLCGGIIAAGLALIAAYLIEGVIHGMRAWAWSASHAFDYTFTAMAWGKLLPKALIGGALIAVVAQTGDFFESWMKRRAGVKDSSQLIPGHGGLFDRADGLLAVAFVTGLLSTLMKALG
jgi:phosphatidate cytidylyltransferase